MRPLPLIQSTHEHSEACPCHSPAFIRINTVLTQQAAKAPPITAATVSAAIPGGQSQHSEATAATAQRKAFINIRLFDGVSDYLRDGLQVIIEGNKIKSIEPAQTPLPAEAEVIDGAGGVLMPGLIDAHWHAIMARPSLKMATSVNAERCAMSGPRNPYPTKLGVIEVGALADMILVDGDPLTDIQLIAQPEQAFRVIIKDGHIYKNTR